MDIDMDKIDEAVLALLYLTLHDARICFPMPALTTTADLPRALAAVAEAISAGTLSPYEAAAVAQVLNVQGQAVELACGTSSGGMSTNRRTTWRQIT